MNRHSKRISNSLRPRIDTLKCMIRYAPAPFDGYGLLKTAISELRKEGLVIIYDKQYCRYYNPQTIDKKWGY